MVTKLMDEECAYLSGRKYIINNFVCVEVYYYKLHHFTLLGKLLNTVDMISNNYRTQVNLNRRKVANSETSRT